MSELNNNENIKSKNNKFLTKGTVIFLVLFTLICVGITATVTYLTLNNRKKQEPDPDTDIIETAETKKVEKIIDTVKGVKDFSETYDENDLEITTIPMDSVEYSNYITISGLKNKTIERAINEEIQNKAEYLATLNPNARETHMMTTASANFSDVLSVNISATYDYGSDNYEYAFIGLNYRLDTGEKIEFEDLFRDSTNIKHILAYSIYMNLIEASAWEKGQMDTYSGQIDVKSVDYSYLEDEVFKKLHTYSNKGITNFCFYNNAISFEIHDKTFAINIPNFYQDIAIYNRFKTSGSLYENSGIGLKNCFVFMNRYKGDYSIFKDFSNNMFVDIFFMLGQQSDYPLSAAEKNDLIAKVNNRLEELRKVADSNTSNAYFYSGMVYANKDEHGNINAELHLVRYEMTKSFYNSDFKTLLGKSYAFRIFGGGIDSIKLNDDNLQETFLDNLDLSVIVYQPPVADDDSQDNND